MFAIKQASFMSILIVLSYAASILDQEANARKIDTEDYINVWDHP